MAIVLDGVVFGLQLSLLAVGLTMVFGLGGVLNLAHGQFAVVTAIVAALLIGGGTPRAVSLVVAVGAAGALALVVDRTLMRPVYALRGDARTLLSLLLTLGLAFLIDGLLISLYPFTALNLRVGVPPVVVLGVPMRASSVVASVIAVTVLAALLAFLWLTRAGKAIRSVIQDEVGAQLCGIDPTRVRTVVFVLSGLLAGLVAITQGLVSSVGASAGLDLTILALIVAVVGGLGRVGGTLVAGLMLGIVHAVATHHIGAFVTVVVLLAVAVVSIVVRPSGILDRGA